MTSKLATPVAKHVRKGKPTDRASYSQSDIRIPAFAGMTAVFISALAFCWFVALGAVHPVLAGPSLEWAIKAEYLFKLPPFVDWPDTAFASADDPFRLCIVGNDPFDGLLAQAGQRQSVGNRPVVLVRVKSASPDDHCQMMYISGDPPFVAQTLAAVNGTAVLTVTDAQSADKGIVNFITVQNRVRFEIDQDAALKNRLNISSKLLQIAASPQGKAP